ncbi:MAG: hypothetical protein QOI52_1962, partial [Chloroflexota bacterium]|nr:hypothetical protein [Chloroflexota bacterium]
QESLGWLVSIGAVETPEGVGPSVTWLGRVAVEAVRSVAHGAVAPTLRTRKRIDAKLLELGVHWAPALVDEDHVAALADAMPGPVIALAQSAPRTVVLSVWTSVVDFLLRTAAARLELPAPPPTTSSAAAVAEAFVTRLDGSSFDAPVAAAAEVMKRLDRWVKPVAHGTSARTRLIVQLEPPDRGNAWYLAVLGRGADGNPLPVEVALADSKDTKAMADELVRLERVLPVLLRPGGLRRGQVYLSQDEAWELMTTTGPMLEAAGFDVRVPKLSRRKPTPGLKLFTGPAGDSVVGAHQLSDVRWSVVFDDVELSAEDLRRIDELAPVGAAAGDRYADMSSVHR